MVPFLANWLGWPAAIASGSVFAITGGALWFFVRADEPMVSLDPADSYSPSAAS
jgi:hypothetical protein